jgi:hypothetical protein
MATRIEVNVITGKVNVIEYEDPPVDVVQQPELTPDPAPVDGAPQ